MVRDQLITALQNLERLVADKSRIETEIAKQRRVVAVLQNLLPPEERENAVQSHVVGLTDAVSDALRATGEWMSTSEIRECMKLSGFDFSGYKASPNSSISTVLRRMTGKQVESTSAADGSRQYRWRPAAAAVLAFTPEERETHDGGIAV